MTLQSVATLVKRTRLKERHHTEKQRRRGWSGHKGDGQYLPSAEWNDSYKHITFFAWVSCLALVLSKYLFSFHIVHDHGVSTARTPRITRLSRQWRKSSRKRGLCMNGWKGIEGRKSLLFSTMGQAYVSQLRNFFQLEPHLTLFTFNSIISSGIRACLICHWEGPRFLSRVRIVLRRCLS